MLTQPLSVLVQQIHDSARETARLQNLRTFRRSDPDFKGCEFCFDTAWGELDDGTVVPCPEHNGLCA